MLLGEIAVASHILVLLQLHGGVQTDVLIEIFEVLVGVLIVSELRQCHILQIVHHCLVDDRHNIVSDLPVFTFTVFDLHIKCGGLILVEHLD